MPVSIMLYTVRQCDRTGDSLCWFVFTQLFHSCTHVFFSLYACHAYFSLNCFIHVLMCCSVGIAVLHEFPPACCTCRTDLKMGGVSTAVHGMWCTSGWRKTTHNFMGGIVTPASTGLKRTKNTGGSML